ncbi:MAG: four helix bundle protein [Paraprevotella sp.]|nr:four helix bundle protein [Paraprevotella sp.]
MKADNVIRQKSMDFAIRIMKLKRFLQMRKEFDISGQVTRSGTAILPVGLFNSLILNY